MSTRTSLSPPKARKGKKEGEKSSKGSTKKATSKTGTKKVKRSKSADSLKSRAKSPTKSALDNRQTGPIDPSLIPFEAGQIFSQYDVDGDGKLDKHEFTEMIKRNPELLRPSQVESNPAIGTIPAEVVSNRILTHFDETAGVAISKNEVEQHKLMGSTVIPLMHAYKARYDRLRLLLTGKLLPKREHLLQLRRQLQNTSIEVDATRKGIERETFTDTEQIIERLRAVESMRQSSIRHQMLQIEEELQAIERLVRRVEQANIDESELQSGSSINVLLTSAHPTTAPVEAIRIPRAMSMVELIHQYSDLHANIERVANKAVTVQVDYPTDDFPRETSERLEVLSKCDRYAHALSVKDHMLWTAMQELEKAEDLLAQERKLSQDYAQEIAKWAEMSQSLTQQTLTLKQDVSSLERRNKDLMEKLREHNIYYT